MRLPRPLADDLLLCDLSSHRMPIPVTIIGSGLRRTEPATLEAKSPPCSRA